MAKRVEGSAASKTVEKTFIIGNKLGLHARPAARFVGLASQFTSTISVRKGQTQVNAKSILDVLTLAATQGSKVTVTVSGVDAEKAMKAIMKLIQSDFGE